MNTYTILFAILAAALGCYIIYLRHQPGGGNQQGQDGFLPRRLIIWALALIPAGGILLVASGKIQNAMWPIFLGSSALLFWYLFNRARRELADPTQRPEEDMDFYRPGMSPWDVIWGLYLTKRHKLLLSSLAVAYLFAFQYRNEYFGPYMREATTLAIGFLIALVVYIQAEFAPRGVIITIAKYYCLLYITGTISVNTCMWLANIYIGHIIPKVEPVMASAVILFCLFWWALSAIRGHAQKVEEMFSAAAEGSVQHRELMEQRDGLRTAIVVTGMLMAFSGIVLGMGAVHGLTKITKAITEESVAPVSAPTPQPAPSAPAAAQSAPAAPQQIPAETKPATEQSQTGQAAVTSQESDAVKIERLRLEQRRLELEAESRADREGRANFERMFKEAQAETNDYLDGIRNRRERRENQQ